MAVDAEAGVQPHFEKKDDDDEEKTTKAQDFKSSRKRPLHSPA